MFARSNGLRENTETAISCRGPGPARSKKEVCQYSSRGEEEISQMCPCGKAIESHMVVECEIYK